MPVPVVEVGALEALAALAGAFLVEREMTDFFDFAFGAMVDR